MPLADELESWAKLSIVAERLATNREPVLMWRECPVPDSDCSVEMPGGSSPTAFQTRVLRQLSSTRAWAHNARWYRMSHDISEPQI